ncbi:type VI secretion system-associated protein [Rubrivivax gelatinosus]|uniref:Type VI secretion system-associated protein n=1 Tax=Rubrivivax gelatinosus TaxID=28068 RepID=A0ABS1DYQ1_RUBGE|nr:type VI secretion system contractile sheath small subunit [Rubrivivax gelatinosus]MBK1613902.1 type VI secretion system-associated protein [Rubrivivax gelatinosus]MBK1714335.1 type VI secretion system-associated protein [Rubrivivax gelatinosus]MBZ8143175.1 type VI secretion system contractile sheath small subunit [Rubrivivax gelatinosus]
MAKKDSVQKRLEKIRPPRVQLTYDVEVGDAIEQKELPFVVGVLGDFTGKQDPAKPLPKLKDRKFVNVDLDNFDDVIKGMAPQASYRVRNKLSEEGGEFAVNLRFDKFDDFRPEAVVQQVEPLKKLLEARTKLADLRNKLAGNEKLEDLLGEVLSNTEQLHKLGTEAQTSGE